MASQPFLLPSTASWAAPAVILPSTRSTEIVRFCKLGLCCWTRATMLRVPNSLHLSLLLDNTLTRNAGKKYCMKLGRFKVWARESSLNSCASLEANKAEQGKMGHSEENSGKVNETWILRLLVAPLLIAAAATVFSIWQTNGITWGQQAGNIFASKTYAETGNHFDLNIFGIHIQTGEGCPGWIYFWLLMAAGCGLFVSEEALNVWVGGTLARTLIFNGTWIDFFSSVSANAAYISSTIIWVYWGVCISDMLPFFAGKFAAQSKASDKLREKVGVSEKKLKSLTEAVQRHGNVIGLVERLSVGVRNPTAFLAGAMMSVGFVFREHPMAALAGVATAVGAWTVLPYTTAGLATIFYVVRSRLWKQHVSKSQVENTSDQ